MNSIRNNVNDDKALDQDLHELEKRYQRIDSDEPPDMLDQAILNRAHRAVEAKNSWLDFGWIHGLTTVGLLVLTLSVVVSMRETGQFDPTSAPLSDKSLKQPEQRQREEPAGELKDTDETEADFQLREDSSALGESRNSVSALAAPSTEPPAAPPARLTVDPISAEMAADKAGTEEPADAGIAAEREAINQKNDNNQSTLAKKERAKQASEPASQESAYATSGPDGNTARDRILQKPAAQAVEIAEDADSQDRLDLAQQAELIAIILQHKQAGDENWKKELEAFKKIYPDYTLPEELKP